MYFFLISSLFLLMSLNKSMMAHSSSTMRKNYTIVVPIMLPMTGNANPMGPWAAASMELALDVINRQSKILPEYNLIMNVGDDQCVDGPALRSALRLFLNYQPEINLQNKTNTEFGTFQPPKPRFENVSANKAYYAPLFMGGICSPACIATARLPHHFNFIDVTHACNDPSLADRRKFPNFYRFLPSLIRVSGIRAQFLDLMKWSRVAIIADTISASYSDVLNLMPALQRYGSIEILATEFYIDLPEEALLRIKATSARIIFASCFVTTCPTLACTAFNLGMYGSKYVWIYRTATDLLSPGINRPPWCTKNMTDIFAERSLYIGADNEGNSLNANLSVTQTGVSLRQYNEYVDSKTRNVTRNGAYSWRLYAFEMVHTAAHILHAVDMELKQSGDTLRDVIVDTSRADELEELIRRKTLTIDIISLYGRVGFLPNTTDPYTPNIIVDQVQNGVRKTVWLYNNPRAPKLADRFQLMIPPKWDTDKTNTPPKSHPNLMEVKRSIPNSLMVSNAVVAIFALWLLVIFDKLRRKNSRLVALELPASSNLHSVSVVGCILIQSTVFVYPSENSLQGMDLFCKIGPILIILGLMIMTSALVLKLWYTVPPKQRLQDSGSGGTTDTITVGLPSLDMIIPKGPSLKRSMWKISFLLIVDLTGIIIWFTVLSPPYAFETRTVREDTEHDVIRIETWLSCGLNETSVYGLTTLLLLQVLVFIVGIAAAIKNRALKFTSGALVSEDEGVAMYIFLSLSAVSILAIASLPGFATLYATMSTFCYACSATSLGIAVRGTYARVIETYQTVTAEISRTVKPTIRSISKRIRTNPHSVPTITVQEWRNSQSN